MNIIAILLTALMIGPAFGLIAQEAQVKDEAKATDEKKADGPAASWDKTMIDFGEIPFKTQKKDEFTLTNKGNQPLFIVYGQSSCGCAKLDYNEAPILPGKSTKVKITYDGTEPGDFLKTISIITNASDERTVLQVKGTVVK